MKTAKIVFRCCVLVSDKADMQGYQFVVDLCSILPEAVENNVGNNFGTNGPR